MEFTERKYGSVSVVAEASQGIELKVNGDPVIDLEVPEGKSWELTINVQIIESDV